MIVASLDRFARSVPDAAVALQRLDAVGGILISVRDSLDTSTPIGRFARTMMLAMAELELDRIRENWRSARDRALDRGVYLSSRTPIGYRKREDGSLEPDPKEARVIRELFRRRARGDSLTTLCEWLDVRLPRPNGRAWRVQTLIDVLHRRAYLGEVNVGDIRRTGTHKALVTREEFEAAIAQDQTQGRHPKRPALLAGIVRCAACGYSMVANRDGARGYSRYDCMKRHAAGVCPSPSGISMPALDEHVEGMFLAWVERNEMVAEAAAATDAHDLAIVRLEAADAELVAYRDANLVSVIGREAFVAGLEERAREVEAARVDLVGAREAASLGEIGSNLREVWPDLSLLERRHVLRAAIDTVAIRRAHLRGRASRVDERAWVYWRGECPVKLPGRDHLVMVEISFPADRPVEVGPPGA